MLRLMSILYETTHSTAWSNIIVEVFDVVPGSSESLSALTESASSMTPCHLQRQHHSDRLMFTGSKSAVSNPYELYLAALLANQDFDFLRIVRTNFALLCYTYLYLTEWYTLKMPTLV